MTGKIYDPNFLEQFKENDADWYEVCPENFEIYGLVPEKNGILTRRIPVSVAQTVRSGVLGMSGYGAGGRVRFSTDSPYISIRSEYGEGHVPTVCNHCVSYGFDLYECDSFGKERFVAAYRPANVGFDYKDTEFTSYTFNDGKMGYYTINMPHFVEVKKMFIGIKKGSRLGMGKKYVNEKPVVFYGSSITHGAAAGRPGNTYESFISQKYNLDYVNLGFAGNAKGDSNMAEYIANLDMSAFVCDYDHNAPNEKHLEDTHYPFYEIIRKKQPEIPYIMVTMPNAHTDPKYTGQATARRNIIKKSYQKAIDNGDKNVYFIDGSILFEGEFRYSCTSDGCHPNDIGFMRMADRIGTVIKDAMKLVWFIF